MGIAIRMQGRTLQVLLRLSFKAKISRGPRRCTSGFPHTYPAQVLDYLVAEPGGEVRNDVRCGTYFSKRLKTGEGWQRVLWPLGATSR